MLQKGEGDIIAYEMPIIGDAKNEWLYCGAENITHQVLIQLRKPKNEMGVIHTAPYLVYHSKPSLNIP